MKTQVWREQIEAFSLGEERVLQVCSHRPVAGSSRLHFGIANGPQGRGYSSQLQLCARRCLRKRGDEPNRRW